MSKLENVTSLVPEVYFDLIGRIPSGTFLVVCILWVLGPDLTKTPISPLLLSPTVFALLLLASGYMAGVLITPFTSTVNWLYRHLTFKTAWKDHCSPVTAFGAAVRHRFGQPDTAKDCERIDRLMHDYLKTHNPQATTILPKMRAETSLCESMCVVFSFAFVVDIKDLSAFPEGRCLFFLIGALSALWAGYYRHGRLMKRQLSFLELTLGQPSSTATRAKPTLRAKRKAV